MMDQFPQRASKPYSLLWRGLIKSCPVCGERQLFSKWVKMVERCPKCNLRFERIEGHWVGAVGMNTIFCSSVSGTGDSFLCHVSRYSHGRMGFCLCRRIWLCSSTVLSKFKKPWTDIDILMRPLEDEDFHESV